MFFRGFELGSQHKKVVLKPFGIVLCSNFALKLIGHLNRFDFSFLRDLLGLCCVFL